jgi:hypothetical protein
MEGICMKTTPTHRSWRILAGLVPAAAVVMAASILPATAERAARSAPGEKAVGGPTVEERIALQQRLSAELTPFVPPGIERLRVVVDISQRDRDELAAPVALGREPLKIGVVKPVDILIGHPVQGDFEGGVVQERPDGTFDWAVNFSSPDAQAIRVHFTQFSLPDGAEMYLLGQNGQAHGPWTGQGRNGDGDFWTRSISGDSATVILRYQGSLPEADKRKISFVISDIGHIHGRPPRPQERNHDNWPCADNAPCVIDAVCGSTGPAEPAEDAVAKLEWITGQFINTCSGGLLADTDAGSQIPYFLTANHCLSSNNSTLETFFFYRTDACNGGCPDSLVTGGTPPAASTVGGTVVATGSAGDFTLLTLNQAPPAGVTFLGWNNAPVANTSGTQLYRISNANFGPQVYSEHDVDAGSPTCTGWPRGQRIYSVDQAGATMGGSSGSPVLNGNSEVVGQLSGCCGFNCGNECDAANNWTVDGALAYYWPSVEQFLDPQGGGCTTNAECNDNLFCTGSETCVAGSCQSSGNPCTGGTTCNESSDTCDAPVCNNDGVCGSGEDCNNCPNDCRQKTNGSPNSRYCCDGDLPECGNAACSTDGWSCGSGGGTCTTNGECDDGQFCNGAETCSGGSCQAGSDPCPGQGCDESSDSCVSCGGNKASCNVNSDCCSNNCRNGSCRGN